MAVDLAGHHGIHETVFQSLLDFCGRLVDLGVTPGTCASVHGSLEMLSSIAPCLSSVGARNGVQRCDDEVLLDVLEGTLQRRKISVRVDLHVFECCA